MPVFPVFWLCFFVFSICPAFAAVQDRQALVIGNSAYDFLPELNNAVTDAEAMRDTLIELGFSVLFLDDASHPEMDEAIRQFGQRLSNNSVALFYYAGHGIQNEKFNYLVPVSAQLSDSSELKYKAVNLNQLLDVMAASKNGMNIVVLDACRDNPLNNNRSVYGGGGLASVEAASGTLIAYATAPGKVAKDGSSNHSPYTQHLLKHMRTPGLKIEEVFKKVLVGVEEETFKQQTPWISSSFSGDFYFIAPQGDVSLIQSPVISPNSDDLVHSFHLVWLGSAAMLLLTSGLLLYIFKFSPQRLNSAIVATPNETVVNPNLSAEIGQFHNPQAAGYLVELESKQALAAILPGQPLILGRSKSRCDVLFDDTAISATHAAIHFHRPSQQFFLQDLQSSNGSWLENQAALTPEVKSPILPKQIFYLAGLQHGLFIVDAHESATNMT